MSKEYRIQKMVVNEIQEADELRNNNMEKLNKEEIEVLHALIGNVKIMEDYYCRTGDAEVCSILRTLTRQGRELLERLTQGD